MAPVGLVAGAEVFGEAGVLFGAALARGSAVGGSAGRTDDGSADAVALGAALAVAASVGVARVVLGGSEVGEGAVGGAAASAATAVEAEADGVSSAALLHTPATRITRSSAPMPPSTSAMRVRDGGANEARSGVSVLARESVLTPDVGGADGDGDGKSTGGGSGRCAICGPGGGIGFGRDAGGDGSGSRPASNAPRSGMVLASSLSAAATPGSGAGCASGAEPLGEGCDAGGLRGPGDGAGRGGCGARGDGDDCGGPPERDDCGDGMAMGRGG